MAQIWLTDREIAALFGLSQHAAYDQAIEANWPFRRSSDGQMRFKVSDGAAHLFMLRYARQYFAIDAGDGDESGEAVEANGRSAAPRFEAVEPREDGAALEATKIVDAVPAGVDSVSEEPATAATPGERTTDAAPVPLPSPLQVDAAVERPGAPASPAASGVRPDLTDADYWASLFQRAFEERMGRSASGAQH
jgi:hypothetical protein